MSTFPSSERPFSTRPLLLSWVVPLSLFTIGGLPLIAFPGRTDVLVVCGLLLIGGVIASLLLLFSRIRVVDGYLVVQHRSLRSVRLNLYELRAVSTRQPRSGGMPALDIETRSGARASIRLGMWRREDELLAILAHAAERARASVDADAEAILRERPSAQTWQMRAAERPSTRIGLWFSRFPRPVRWVTQLALYGFLIVAISVGMAQAARLSETVLFPRQVDPAWTPPVGVVSGADTWVGNLAITGDRIVLETREEIGGFWGTIRVRSSANGGSTWSAPVDLSGAFDAARHTLVTAEDGSLFAAWSKRGPAAVTQRLVLRRSVDGGRSWGPEAIVAIPAGGTVAVPAVVMTRTVRMIAYTDGVTGQIWSQPLKVAGSPDGPPTLIDTATRQLYSDSPFIDGDPAVVAVGKRAVLVYVYGEQEVRSAVSDDSGRTWRRTEINQSLFNGRPRLATDGSTVVLAVDDPNSSARNVRNPFIRIWRSIDSGTTWERGPDVTDVASLGSLDATWSDDRWRLLYAACPGIFGCATDPRIWYATSADALSWSEPSVVSEPGQVGPIGVVTGRGQVSVAWGLLHSSHDWDVVVSRRADP
jgi:hypothetical protein